MIAGLIGAQAPGDRGLTHSGKRREMVESEQMGRRVHRLVPEQHCAWYWGWILHAPDMPLRLCSQTPVIINTD